MGIHLRFNSDSLGILVTFPWWDEIDKFLRKKPDFFPVGTSVKPFESADECWNIWIWQEGDFIYMLEGDDPLTLNFPVWFKVESESFKQEWEKIMVVVQEKE